MKRILAIALCLVTVACLFAACSSNSSPEKVVKTFVKAINNKDVDLVMTVIPPNEQDSAEEKEMIKEFFDELYDELDGKKIDITIKDVEYNSRKDVATVKISGTWGNEKLGDESITVREIDGKWYLKEYGG